MKLYTYWRSTSSYRVRIALALKGIEAQHIFVHLVRNGGEHYAEPYRSINPQGRVPALELDDGSVLIQSPAIIEYLEEIRPTPALLPKEPAARAKVRSVAAIIGCDIHPLHNVGPLNYLRRTYDRTESDVARWVGHWTTAGFEAIETMIADEGYCFGEYPNLADVYLVPQIYTARRFNVPLDAFPRIQRVEELCSTHPAFNQASPARQEDAE
ncbi:maleylacetoacetate isomerase [Aquamicrobium defluvii]|uniref:Maleylacetoacetate isomerase n=1 Tax=Aquamicrobium defluvii TaxID=69279 RepID=A0A011U6L7_9HYPH|nr:maleylacetoacetate isomerase [Aquamicrobium defluvii]EXL01483.1 maleylacetoacetate isomerase [Aquamicrobium defluvii]EZQ12726.1 maleylacetoacetate isomerase [Halopseudomonas bauzanensis]